jgi:hypothetical protein
MEQVTPVPGRTGMRAMEVTANLADWTDMKLFRLSALYSVAVQEMKTQKAIAESWFDFVS